jgi:ATP:ADP antiporter, AAA family
MREKQLKKELNHEKREESNGLISKTLSLFRRVPTLAALFGEVVSFQSLSTVLNVCFVRQLKESLPLDTDRASFTGRLYAYVNGMAGLTQFILLPLLRNFLEPRWAYKIMPCLLIPLLGYLNWTIMTGAGTALVAGARPSLLWLTAASFFCLKTLDYAFRNVINEMVFQPLDFDSRYLGKEVIGVFANRFGKSGMSLILSLATATFGASVVGVPQLSQCSLAVGGAWAACSWWLSQYLPTNQEAEQRVQERNKAIQNTSNQEKQE